ncbi:MAG TPA: tetratricopeptide repeat protein [Tahibacter sp.]|nr:tetratricopeptide repeat protein [Tahibacter sp.]
MRFVRDHQHLLWLIATILATIVAYAPGLHGDFLFDDFVNLNALGDQGRIDNAAALWRYLTSGTADPTGRPLSLLTFLLDANDWPADPYPFKRTSLILHVLNGVLLYALLRRLGAVALENGRTAANAAVFGAALWLLHPLFVSTTMYVVQREAMLPATSTLLGLIAYVAGRRRIADGRLVSGAWLMVCGIGAGTVLATLSKANGILLPLLALVVESVLLAPRLGASDMRGERLLKHLRLVLLYLPSVLIVAYLLVSIPQSIAMAARARPWTLAERVMSEGRILFDYLALLLVPRPFSAGLFNDDVVVSTSLTTPWSTLPGLVGAIALPALCWVLRRRMPILAAAVLFFFAGHLLESTVIALELYFEHRNYVPAMLLFWPLAVALTGDGRWQAARRFAGFALPLLLVAMTHAHAKLWGNPVEQAIVWAALSPDSPRAQSNAAQYEMNTGDPAAAQARLLEALARHPDELQLALNLLAARCRLGSVGTADVDAITQALRNAQHSLQLTFKWLDNMVAPVAAGECPGLELAQLEAMIVTARANPRLNNAAGRAQELEHIIGRIALLRGDPDQALLHFNLGLDAEPRPVVVLKQAALLASAGHPRQALVHLDRFERARAMAAKPPFGMARIHAWVLARQGYFDTEYRQLRATIERDAREQRQSEPAAQP